MQNNKHYRKLYSTPKATDNLHNHIVTALFGISEGTQANRTYILNDSLIASSSPRKLNIIQQ